LHVEAPVSSWYWPLVQVLHVATLPARRLKVDTGQEWHTRSVYWVGSANMNWPASHVSSGVHSRALLKPARVDV
jgi:hypothetical protein